MRTSYTNSNNPFVKYMDYLTPTGLVAVALLIIGILVEMNPNKNYQEIDRKTFVAKRLHHGIFFNPGYDESNCVQTNTMILWTPVKDFGNDKPYSKCENLSNHYTTIYNFYGNYKMQQLEYRKQQIADSIRRANDNCHCHHGSSYHYVYRRSHR